MRQEMSKRRDPLREEMHGKGFPIGSGSSFMGAGSLMRNMAEDSARVVGGDLVDLDERLDKERQTRIQNVLQNEKELASLNKIDWSNYNILGDAPLSEEEMAEIEARRMKKRLEVDMAEITNLKTQQDQKDKQIAELKRQLEITNLKTQQTQKDNKIIANLKTQQTQKDKEINELKRQLEIANQKDEKIAELERKLTTQLDSQKTKLYGGAGAAAALGAAAAVGGKMLYDRRKSATTGSQPSAASAVHSDERAGAPTQMAPQQRQYDDDYFSSDTEYEYDSSME